MQAHPWVAIAALCLAACNPTVQSQTVTTPEVQATVPAPTAAPASTNRPKTLKLTLKLDQPENLRVRKGDAVTKGQILSDRTSTRIPLQAQRKALLAKLQQLDQNQTVPPISTATEAAEVKAAEIAIAQAEQAIKALEASSPYTAEGRTLLGATEQQQLLQLQQTYETAKANLTVAQGKLKDARLVRKAPSGSLAQQDGLFQQLAALERDLKTTGISRSPYSGRIKAVHWLGQSGSELQVELTLDITAPRPTSQAQQPTPSPSKATGDLWDVIGAHDGDTIRVQRGSTVEKIRFACIDAPELKQTLGVESRDYLRSQVQAANNQVRLNIVDTDRYGRKVSEVYTPDGELIQQRQAQAGMVYVYEQYIDDCPSADQVRAAQATAQSQSLGVWNGNHQTPWDSRKSKRKKSNG